MLYEVITAGKGGLPVFPADRRSLGGEPRGRRLGWSVTTVVCAAAVARGAAWWVGTPVPRMLAFELLGYSVATVLIGIGVHRSFLAVAPA